MDFSLSSGERKAIHFQERLKSSFQRVLNRVACKGKDLNLKQTQGGLLSFSYLKGRGEEIIQEDMAISSQSICSFKRCYQSIFKMITKCTQHITLPTVLEIKLREQHLPTCMFSQWEVKKFLSSCCGECWWNRALCRSGGYLYSNIEVALTNTAVLHFIPVINLLVLLCNSLYNTVKGKNLLTCNYRTT